ncbi:hypothetical protein MC885_001682 [Smutsia gigantea]|nr:hypothetical protein MC885_001682 [Smutsia gigantea]
MRLCGHLRRQKSQRRRLFVLRADPPPLECYASEKSRAGRARPKLSVSLASACTIHKRVDALQRYLIILYTRDCSLAWRRPARWSSGRGTAPCPRVPAASLQSPRSALVPDPASDDSTYTSLLSTYLWGLPCLLPAKELTPTPRVNILGLQCKADESTRYLTPPAPRE